VEPKKIDLGPSFVPAVDGLVNAGVILMHELMGMLKQEVDAMEDSSQDNVLLGACDMKVVLGHE